MSERYTPHVDETIWSPNKSSREGAHPTLIVIHATVSHNKPGLDDLTAIGNYFAETSTQASSHVCTDNEGHSARYVRDGDKAWHCAAFNRLSLGIEQILPGDGSELSRNLYRETARWVARWSKIWHIPIQKGAVSGYTVTRPGVVRHSELGRPGGGHSDPGVYDMHAMLSLARFYRSKI